jgi:hypothetical protein
MFKYWSAMQFGDDLSARLLYFDGTSRRVGVRSHRFIMVVLLLAIQLVVLPVHLLMVLPVLLLVVLL